MHLGDPLADVVPGARGALLRALIRLEQPVSRRQLAALAGISASSARGVISDLVARGLVLEIPAGNTTLVALNRQHLAFQHLAALTRLRSQLIEQIRQELASWPGLSGAWLFGSTARGDSGPDSDIDLLLILEDPDSPTVHTRMEHLHEKVRLWTGNEVQIVEHTPSSWRQLAQSGNALVQELRNDGVALFDNDPSHLRRTR